MDDSVDNGNVFKIGVGKKKDEDFYVALVGETYWRGSRPLKKRFSTMDDAKKYLNDFMDRYNRLYNKARKENELD